MVLFLTAFLFFSNVSQAMEAVPLRMGNPETTSIAPLESSEVVERNPVNFKDSQLIQVGLERKNEEKQRVRQNTFNRDEKKLINSILGQIMLVIESSRDGTAKLRMAALYLQELIKAHQEMELGSADKINFLKDMAYSARAEVRALSQREKYDMTQEEISHELAQLARDGYDDKIIQLLKDYRVDQLGNLKACGLGAAGLVGIELHLGTLVTATGRIYLTGCMAGSIGPQIGIYPSYMAGKSKINGDWISFESDKALLQLDTFLAGFSEAHSTNDGVEVKLHDYVMGLRAGALRVSKPFRSPLSIPAFIGRDYSYLESFRKLLSEMNFA